MPIITRKEFADLCGDDEKKVNVWISRAKIILTPESKKLINTEDPINALFISDRQLANAGKEPGESVIKKPKIVPKEPKIVTEKPVKQPKSSEKVPNKSVVTAKKQPKEVEKVAKKVVKVIAPTPPPKQNAEIFALSRAKMDQDMQAKAQEMELRDLRIQSEKIRLDKTAGNLLPIDLATGVIERHANSILKTFEKGFERITEIYSNMAGFDPDQRAEFLRECRQELADCVTKAGTKSQEEIEILVDNYSEELMKGQRKA